MNIPDKALESIARALFSRDASGHGVLRAWEQIPEASRRYYITDAQLIVEDAAPFIAAQAWHEGFEEGYDHYATLERVTITAKKPDNPYLESPGA